MGLDAPPPLLYSKHARTISRTQRGEHRSPRTRSPKTGVAGPCDSFAGNPRATRAPGRATECVAGARARQGVRYANRVGRARDNGAYVALAHPPLAGSVAVPHMEASENASLRHPFGDVAIRRATHFLGYGAGIQTHIRLPAVDGRSRSPKRCRRPRTTLCGVIGLLIKNRKV